MHKKVQDEIQTQKQTQNNLQKIHVEKQTNTQPY